MIIGTAGHIDHGKSALVRALTGVDTDRLPEEKARGISIDLGYAYLALDNGEVLGFVDVPGHERFVRTMIAGAAGIDFALLVVAADDGVMPQTREHLAILSILGVERGVVALTKADRVDERRLQEVGHGVRALLAASPLANVDLYPVSAVTGQGLDKLLAAFALHARACGQGAKEGRFRLAVDRAFVLPGIGTVATGTVFSGQVCVGDQLAIVPGEKSARVRGLHAQNRAARCASVGQRCALQLAGISRDEVHRGNWAVSEDSRLATNRFDAHLRLLPEEPHLLKHWAPVHLHVGAAHVSARVALLEAKELVPGQCGFVQLVTSEPIACWHGDRFVLRDQSAQRTIGGGQVLDPFGWPRHRRNAQRIEMLRALQRPSTRGIVAALIDTSVLGLDLAQLRRSMNSDLDAALAGIPGLQRIRAGEVDIGFAGVRWQAMKEALLARIAEFHAQVPEELGPDNLRIRRMIFPQLHPLAHASLVEELLASGQLAKSGPWLHLPQHRVRLSSSEEALAQRLKPMLEESGFSPPWVRDLAFASGEAEGAVRMTLLRLARRGEVFQVVRDLFYTQRSVGQLAQISADLQLQRGAVRAAEFRDETGLGRKRAIQILEFFDRIGFTRRIGDTHVLRGDSLLGLAEPARSQQRG